MMPGVTLKDIYLSLPVTVFALLVLGKISLFLSSYFQLLLLQPSHGKTGARIEQGCARFVDENVRSRIIPLIEQTPSSSHSTIIAP